MSLLDQFLERLEIQESISFSNSNEVALFDLWKIQISENKCLTIQEKNAFGVWEEVELSNCHIPLFIESGRVVFDTRHSSNFEEMLDHEHNLLKWKTYFTEAIFKKLTTCYDYLNYRRTKITNNKILNFINNKLVSLNLEKFACLVSMLHSFFQDKLFSLKPLSEVFPYVPDKIRISTLLNLTIHSEAIKIYNKFLPNHLAMAKFIHISPELLKVIETSNFLSKSSFAKLILSNIDDQARFDNSDIAFFISCDHLTLQQLSQDKKTFIPWLQFFSKVARNCKFHDIHLLFKEFMKIGLKGCIKNRKYVEAIFSFFQSKSFQNNTSDLSYAIGYSLIFNSMNWNCSYSGNVDRYINNLDCGIDDIRKLDVFRAFMRFENEANYLKAGYSYGSLSKDFVKELLINCHILVGLDCNDTMFSDIGFVLQRVGDSYVLIGSDNQPDRSFYHTIIVGNEVDLSMTKCADYEGYFDEVLRSYAY